MSAQPHALHIDIPVKLDDVRAVFSSALLPSREICPHRFFI